MSSVGQRLDERPLVCVASPLEEKDGTCVADALAGSADGEGPATNGDRRTKVTRPAGCYTFEFLRDHPRDLAVGIA